ncbi:MAG: hypothetical protein V1903_13875 [Bacteroidota bacterium]
MKTFKLLILVIFCASANPVVAQMNNPSSQEQEPGCACDQPEFIVSLGGKLKIDYKEMNICNMPDGSLLLQDRNAEKYYIISGGITSGPYESGDPKIMEFDNCYMGSTNTDDQLLRYKGILSKPGGKYLITLKGKTYGPFAEIYDFIVSLSKEKFVVLAAKQEGEIPSLVSNIPNAAFDINNEMNLGMDGFKKYDDIVVVGETRITDLQGKTIFSVDSLIYSTEGLFLNQNNSRYAWYNYGTLAFSDGRSFPDCFNPHFVKTGGTEYIAYMYYSPVKNAIMQCKVPF